jgi:hypothetical protein
MTDRSVVFRGAVFNILAVLFLLGAGYLLLHDPNLAGAGRGGVAFLIAAFCGLLGNIDSFKSIDVTTSGFKATLREAKEVIEDARASVAQLHELTTLVGSFAVERIAAAGRVGGPLTNQQKDKDKRRIIEQLRAMGLSDDVLAKVSHADRFWVSLDYVYGIFSPLFGHITDAGWPKLSVEDISAVRGEALPGNEPASPDKCESILKRLGVSEPFANELLTDYKYYCSTSEQRRPEVWSNRAFWAKSRT